MPTKGFANHGVGPGQEALRKNLDNIPDMNFVLTLLAGIKTERERVQFMQTWFPRTFNLIQWQRVMFTDG